MGVMKFSFLMAASLPFLSTAFAGVKSGHAEAELLSGTASYQAGKPVPIGIRLKFESGWHGYWINPGEAGMPLSAKWTLPEGWKAGELRQPVPKRFKTGELAGFGYEGEAVYLVDLTPPAGATGEAECKVKLSWLTCNDSACVPGNVELSLKLPAGDGASGQSADLISAAEKKIPVPAEGTTLSVKESDGNLAITLSVPESLDLTDAKAYPATPQVVSDTQDLVFERKDGVWVAAIPKNEYAEGPVALLDIVLYGGKLSAPLSVSWRAKE
jgi:DsbC/DsbD-like thiol-disulfide interchange protein